MYHKQGWACKKQTNKAGMQTQDYPTTEKCGEIIRILYRKTRFLYRKNVVNKDQKTTLQKNRKTRSLQKNCGKERRTLLYRKIERLGDQATDVVQSFFTRILLQQGSLLVFSSLPCSCTFHRNIPTCGSFFQKKFYHQFMFLLCYLAANL